MAPYQPAAPTKLERQLAALTPEKRERLLNIVSGFERIIDDQPAEDRSAAWCALAEELERSRTNVRPADGPTDR
jgi:hypothetical protein